RWPTRSSPGRQRHAKPSEILENRGTACELGHDDGLLGQLVELSGLVHLVCKKRQRAPKLGGTAGVGDKAHNLVHERLDSFRCTLARLLGQLVGVVLASDEAGRLRVEAGGQLRLGLWLTRGV